MEYIESPKDWSPIPAQPGLFLAGGITGCPDWQAEVVKALRHTNYAVLNPRRKHFPIDDPIAAYEQIKWEHDHLIKAHIILFWFCAETIQPIALYELGAWSRGYKHIIVGAHPDYPRRVDVEIQTQLARPGLVVYTSLENVIDATIVRAPFVQEEVSEQYAERMHEMYNGE